MKPPDAASLRGQFEAKPTEELLLALRDRQKEEWLPEAYSIMELVLHERGIKVEEATRAAGRSVPPQDSDAQSQADLNPLEIPDDFVRIAQDLDFGTAEDIGRTLVAAGLAFRLRPQSFALDLFVKDDDVRSALSLLENEGFVPKQPSLTDKAVGQEGGPCPACGVDVAPRSLECPGCGLALGSPE